MCTFDRREYFAEAAVADEVCEHLLATAVRWDVEVIAYCFMPDHVHVLVEGRTESADCRKCVDVFRQVSGFHFRRAHGKRLWQDGYFDRVLRDEDATLTVVSYIVLNPVRAGVCRAASDYPLLGSSRYALSELLTATEWDPHPLG